MSSVPHVDRRPAEVAPAVALVLAIAVTFLPHATRSEILSAEPARTITTLNAEVAR